MVLVVLLALVGADTATAGDKPPKNGKHDTPQQDPWAGATVTAHAENATAADLNEVPSGVLLSAYGSTSPSLTTQPPPVATNSITAEPDATNGGCWRGYVENGQSTATGYYFLHFNPLWCGNGWSVTYTDPSWFYQTCDGWYSCDGRSGPYYTDGCIGCGSISYRAYGQFTWHTWFGYSSGHDLSIGTRLYGYCGYIDLI
jgi:hypothetical protein